MRQRRGAITGAMIGALGAGALAGGVALLVLHLPPVIAWLAGGGVATMLLYGFDKAQARRGGWRIAERTLLAAAVLGGVMGAWAGMALFRHKTRHRSFVLVNTVATALWAALIWWGVR